jgi:hypothetical protein
MYTYRQNSTASPYRRANMKPESYFYQNKLKSFLGKCGFLCHRIETGSTQQGFPDLYCEGNGKDFFAEIKIGNLICETKKIKVSWRPGQIGWGSRHKKLMHRWFVFIRVGQTIYYSVVGKKEYSLLELKILVATFYEEYDNFHEA